MLNIKFEKFKKTHKKKINQVLYYELKSNNSREVENLINNFLQDKNSFIFESVEKGIIKGRYTIFGKNPDKIWEFNNKNIYYLTLFLEFIVVKTSLQIITMIQYMSLNYIQITEFHHY